MPKVLDVRCEDGHVERNRYYSHMDDELGLCRTNGCGKLVSSMWDKVQNITLGGVFTPVTYEGLFDNITFNSVAEMDAHLNDVRRKQKDETLEYHFPTAKEQKRKQSDAADRYYEGFKAEGISEKRLKEVAADRANGGKATLH